MYLKLAVVSFFLNGIDNFPHIEHLPSTSYPMCCTGIRFSFNCKLPVSQALKIGDNNVIESKGETFVSFSVNEQCFSVDNCGILEEV